MCTTKGFGWLSLALLVVLSLAASPALAGPLFSNTNAMVKGSQNTSAGSLDVDIEWAVYTAADFESNYGTVDYDPDDSMLVYTYQVINKTPSEPVNLQIVVPASPAQDIGTFNIGDIDATVASLAGNAQWFFTGTNISPGQTSYGLAYSSPNLPVLALNSSLTVSTFGNTAIAVVHVPGTEPYYVPEPVSALLLGLGGLALMAYRRRR